MTRGAKFVTYNFGSIQEQLDNFTEAREEFLTNQVFFQCFIEAMNQRQDFLNKMFYARIEPWGA